MPQFRIYAGLGGGCGGAYYQETDDFNTKEEAETRAYEIACECYESQQGSGIEGWEDFMEEARSEIDSQGDNLDDEEYEQAVEAYAIGLEDEARESWVDYYVIKVTDENVNIDPEEYTRN